MQEFVENENAMTTEDLKILREWSRELDSKDSKYRCVVSVMMPVRGGCAHRRPSCRCAPIRRRRASCRSRRWGVG